jgi:hypothetical protein
MHWFLCCEFFLRCGLICSAFCLIETTSIDKLNSLLPFSMVSNLLVSHAFHLYTKHQFQAQKTVLLVALVIYFKHVCVLYQILQCLYLIFICLSILWYYQLGTWHSGRFDLRHMFGAILQSTSQIQFLWELFTQHV